MTFRAKTGQMGAAALTLTAPASIKEADHAFHPHQNELPPKEATSHLQKKT